MYDICCQVKESDEVQVRLNSPSVLSSGRYRCEANTEAPVFDSVSASADMLVVGECYKTFQSVILCVLH